MTMQTKYVRMQGTKAVCKGNRTSSVMIGLTGDQARGAEARRGGLQVTQPLLHHLLSTS